MWRPAISGGGISAVVPGNINFTGNVDIDGTLNVDGVATFVTTVTGSGNIMAGAAFALGFTGRGQWKSSADGFLEAFATNGSTAAAIGMGTGAYFGLSAAAVIGVYGASLSVGSSLALASDKTVKWSSTTDPDGTADAGIERNAAGYLKITDGSTGVGQLYANGFLSFTNVWRLTDTATGLRLRDSGLLSWTAGSSDAAQEMSIGRSAANIVGLYSGTAKALGSSLVLASDKKVLFSSTTDPDGTVDVAFSRNGAGIGQVEDGAGALEDLKADYFWLVNEGTNGSDACTLLNGPNGTAGNPDKWLKVKGSDGTVYVVPAWTPT